MSIPNLSKGVARFEPKIVDGLLRKMVGSYKFFNENEVPTSIVVPLPDTIDGIKVIVEKDNGTGPNNSDTNV